MRIPKKKSSKYAQCDKNFVFRLGFIFKSFGIQVFDP